jgi:hypothetical protein
VIDGATVVWVTEGPSPAAATPSDEARRSLDAWATARGVRLEEPQARGAPALTIDWSAADAVEQGLARVRDALAGLDFDAAERELARAEIVLRDHPELPQAAWLRAEVERAWSMRWLRGGDEARAKRAWQRAAGLDGGREPGLGEKAFEVEPPITASLRLGGGDASAGLVLDGVSVAAGEVKRAEGEHALAIVNAEGATTWAAWVSLAQGIEVRIAAPDVAACSRADVARARLDGEALRSAGVRCPHWVAAVAAGDGVVRVATCEAASCGPFAEWRPVAPPPPGWAVAPVTPAESHSRWPAWATWTLVGVGVVGAGVAVAAAAGAFRSTPTTETQFVNGGLEVHSF